MTAEQARKLARIKNRHTRYEVVLTNGTGRYLLQYTAMHSQRGILEAVRDRWEALAAITDGLHPWMASRGRILPAGSDWHVMFSGRTQREAILDGELPFAKTPEVPA